MVGAADTEWRRHVLDTISSWTVGLGGVLATLAVLVLGLDDRAQLLHPGALTMFGAYAGLVALRYAIRMPYFWRALGYCVLVLVIGTSGLFVIGILPAPVLVNTVAVVSARLFLGRRAMLTVLFAASAGLGAVALSVAPELVPMANGERPYETLLGLRLVAGFALVSSILAVLVGHVLARIEHSLEVTAAALEQRRRAEEERARTEAELRKAEEALLRSQKLEAVGRLAAGVGHDFNNVLQVMLSWASMLREDADPELTAEGLDAIEQVALHGSELTRRLLAFGRQDVGAATVIAPAGLLEASAKSLSRLLPEDIEIALDVGEDVPNVRADAAQLSHVLLNLGLNARDAMPKGGKLVLGLRGVERGQLPAGLPWPAAPERWVHLWVRDTGTGIDAATRAHMFEPFFTTKGERGTGLGLATAYAIVQRNQGFIHVESEPGHGAQFSIYLPGASAPASSVAVRSGALRRHRAPALVMVAEDDENVRKSLVAALRASGFRVAESEDTASALRRVEALGALVDVLCTDGVMPKGSTHQLIRRYLERRPDGQVIVCSGYVEEELLRRDIDTGACAYLPKPFQPEELVARIDELLARRSGVSLS